MSFAGPKTDEMLAWYDVHKRLPRLFIMGDTREAKRACEFTPEDAEEVRHAKWLFRIVRAYRVLLRNDQLEDRDKKAMGDMSHAIAAMLDTRMPEWRTKL